GHGSAKLNLPGTLNRYSYVNNDPINNIDPTGEDWEDWIRFFAESACRSQGGSFWGLGFLPGGDIGFWCSGGLARSRGPTKAELIALGEWTPRTAPPGRIVPIAANIVGGEMKSFATGVRTVELTLPSCNDKDKFQVRVEFNAFNIKEILPIDPNTENKSKVTISSDDPANPQVIRAQATGIGLSSNTEGFIFLDTLLAGTTEEIAKAEKWISFRIAGRDRNDDPVVATVKVVLKCPGSQ
ncbi:MAG: hypothetical protein ACREBD_31980, partial [Blastocatellia bacterium]